MPDYEVIAAGLRTRYWAVLGEYRGPWEEASDASKAAWVAVAKLASELNPQ